MTSVFLGGTCNGSQWRESMIPKLNIDYFNPVVENWDEEARQREIEARENSTYCLYVLTPRGKGLYSIAEVVDDSNKRPEKTIFVPLSTDEDIVMDRTEWKHLKQVAQLVERNGAMVFYSLQDAADYINTAHQE